ncbi:multiheme c-type cytochrome [Sulfidibacter corallicola]|uniref:NapC/NirT family cytochrome c n=1 Tax=Sulfidibacter corallicola TaxID=2818388 RepID=A0A8A4TQP9_SULCO|nr:multiheme c-type cytochrome [Sulfidibacter corallicola]QTD51412.1 NapC/NirT family cytochrome c [Sulfidibacter corallicola]
MLCCVLILPLTMAQDKDEKPKTADEEHAALFLENRFPSANTCAGCHPTHYREWSVSPHAYAQISPVFNAFHGAVVALTNGTNGDFCIRCHTPVGMNLGEPVFMSNMDRHPTSREGVTCIVCHRVNKSYGKLSGRLAIVEGDLFDTVYGPTGNSNLAEVIDSGEFGVNPDRNRAGRSIHGRADKFFQLTTSGLCGTCHDVNLVNGFRLEEAFSEFKHSPAAKKGISCQDCHMGIEPGIPSGYAQGPAAIVGEKPTQTRKITNHMFIGPDHSVVHPGIFPHNPKAAELATIREWLLFDYESGWGTDEFERKQASGYEFPEKWASADDRYDARDIITANQKLLDEAHADRKKILQAAYQLGEIKIERASAKRGIVFKVQVRNATEGHGAPTGFDAERLVFLQVTVTDREGSVVFTSGDLDPNGDVRDSHSLYVHNGELPLDRYLFSLQSRFITRMLRGGDREQVLAINYSPSPLVFLRPSTTSTILTGRPGGARKHKQGIEPLGHRWAKYKVRGRDLTGKGPYKANIKFIAAMIPVNLLNEIKVVGFDYFMSARDVAEEVVKGHLVLWERDVTIDVDDVAAQVD